MQPGKSGRRFQTAFILGAGLGTRLRPLTLARPKPLLDLGGRPVITYAMDHCIRAGVDRFIVNTHHCPEAYMEMFPDRQWRGRPILFRHETVLLDTGGGLKNIEDLVGEDDAILCYNGDVVADFPLEALLRFHDTRRPDATLALRSDGPVRNVALDAHNSIRDIRNTLGHSGEKECLFTGIYAVETSLLRYIEAGAVESIIAVFLERIRERPGSIAGIVVDNGEWHDIGSPESYRSLKRILQGRRSNDLT